MRWLIAFLAAVVIGVVAAPALGAAPGRTAIRISEPGALAAQMAGNGEGVVAVVWWVDRGGRAVVRRGSARDPGPLGAGVGAGVDRGALGRGRPGARG